MIRSQDDITTTADQIAQMAQDHARAICDHNTPAAALLFAEDGGITVSHITPAATLRTGVVNAG